jgi:hypothetical protein
MTQPSWLSLLCFRIKTKDHVLKWDRVNHLASIFILAVECWVGFVGYKLIGQGVSTFAFCDVTTDGWMSRAMHFSFYVNVLLTYPATFLVMRDQVMGVFMPKARFDPFAATAVAASRDFRTLSRTDQATTTTAHPEYVAMVDDDTTSSAAPQSTSSARPQSRSIRSRAEQGTRSPAWFCWVPPHDTRRHTILLTLVLQTLVCALCWCMRYNTSSSSAQYKGFRKGLSAVRSLFSLVFGLYIVTMKMSLNVRGEHVGARPCDRSSEPRICGPFFTMKMPSLWALFLPYNDDSIFYYQIAAGAYTQDIILATVIVVLVIGYFLTFFEDTAVAAAGVGGILMLVLIVSLYFLCMRPFAKTVETKIVEGRYESSFSYSENSSTRLSSSQEIPVVKRKDITIPFEELKFEANVASGAFGIVSKYRYFGNIVAVKQVSSLFCLFACHICPQMCLQIYTCAYSTVSWIESMILRANAFHLQTHDFVCVCVCRLKKEQTAWLGGSTRMKLSNWRSRTAQTS